MLIGLLPSAALADAGGPGQLHSTAFHVLPAGTAIAVRPLDDSPVNLDLRKVFIEALRARQRGLAADEGAVVLEFQSEIQGIKSGREPLYGRGVTTNRETRLRLNMWSNTEDSLLAGRAPGSELRGSVRYVLRATLDDRRGGRRLWQGQAIYDRPTADDLATLKAMVSPLIDALGRSVRAGGFTIDGAAATD